jgi:hypothetical protein
MDKKKVFSNSALLMAAKAGAKKGYNRWVDDMEAFKAKIDASGLDVYPVTWWMVHEHICGLLVEPHIRVGVSLGASGEKILDVDMEMYNRLPFEGETEVWQVKHQHITEFLEHVEADPTQLSNFHKGLSFPLGHILSQTDADTWVEMKRTAFDEMALRKVAGQVREWGGDRSPNTPMFWAHEILAVSLECAAVNDPIADKCEELTDAIINRAFQEFPISNRKENNE